MDWLPLPHSYMRVLMFIIGYVTSVAPSLASEDSRKISHADARAGGPRLSPRLRCKGGSGGAGASREKSTWDR